MRISFFAIASLVAGALAQNCGPQFANQKCAAGLCCSQYGWCDTSAAHCNPANCLKQFSGAGSSCANNGITTSVRPPPSQPTTTFPSVVPEIDICGSAKGGVQCPGAGVNGYYYRCCSSAGHCGPKNPLQDQAMYCGAGCQGGFGKCDSQPIPNDTPVAPGTAQAGQTCGPIVNRRCASGLCCSGSNFCGTGVDFCGSANWCQAKWGRCG